MKKRMSFHHIITLVMILSIFSGLSVFSFNAVAGVSDISVGKIYNIRPVMQPVGRTPAYLNVYGGNDTDGTSVCMWKKDATIDQKFILLQGVNGTYKLQAACSNSRVLGIKNSISSGEDVEISTPNNNDAQNLKITQIRTGVFCIQLNANPSDNLVLTATNTSDSSAVKFNERISGASNQEWIFEEVITVSNMPSSLVEYYGDLKETFHPASQMTTGTWLGANSGSFIDSAIRTFYNTVYGIYPTSQTRYLYCLYGAEYANGVHAGDYDDGPGFYHSGVDINKGKGSDITSAHSGIVEFIMISRGTVAIYDSHNEKTYVYMHMDIDPRINKGTEIVRGITKLGKEGDNGAKGNPHLHIEVHKGRADEGIIKWYDYNNFSVAATTGSLIAPYAYLIDGNPYNPPTGAGGCSVTYNANGTNVTNMPANQHKDDNKDLTLSTTVPIRNGYQFLGWAITSTATSATYQPGAIYKNNTPLDLYAVWRASSSQQSNILTIKYNFFDGTYTPGTGTRTYAKNASGVATVDLPTTTKNGYNFAGWTIYNTSSGTLRSQKGTVSISTPAGTDTVLTAEVCWTTSGSGGGGDGGSGGNGLAAPSSFTATVASSTAVILEWNTVPGATGYYVYRDGIQRGSCSLGGYIFNGLSPDTTYSFYVKAYNSSGISDATQTKTVTTSGEPTAPAKPSAPVASNITATSITFTWNRVSGATWYELCQNGKAVWSGTATTATLRGLTPNSGLKSYYVRAYNNLGEFRNGYAINVGTLPAATLTASSPSMLVEVGAGIYGRVPIEITAPSTGSVTIQSSNSYSASSPTLYDEFGNILANMNMGSGVDFRYIIPTGQKMTVYAGTYLNIASTYTITGFFPGSNVTYEQAFPDVNFRAWVLAFIGGGRTATSTISTADRAAMVALKRMDVYKKDIADLTGIDYFTGLGGLDCGSNQLTRLDVSKNTALTALDCEKNQLTSLDVSNNTELTSLGCEKNQLTSLDVSINKKLGDISIGDNQLSSLDVSNNKELNYLCIDDNQLTTLDISENAKLEYLLCENNQLTSLDVSNMYTGDYAAGIYVTPTVRCAGNFMESPDSVVGWQEVGMKINSPTNPNSGSFRFYNQQEILTYSKAFPDANFRAWVLGWLGGGRTAASIVTALDEAMMADLEIMDIPDKDIADLTGIEYFTGLAEIYCHDNNLTELDLSKNVGLNTLYCYQNQLMSLSLSKNISLRNLYCGFNPLISLDVTKNTELRHLQCKYTRLTELDVSKNTTLLLLACDNNQLKTLNLTTNIELLQLWCNSNELEMLDISKNTALTRIDCSNNLLTELDVTKNIALTELLSQENYIESTTLVKGWQELDLIIDSPSNSNNCTFRFYNQLIDVTELTYDEAFPDVNFRTWILDWIGGGRTGACVVLGADRALMATLEYMDISGLNIVDLTGIEYFEGLSYLSCGFNQLRSLDVTGIAALTWLDCSSNQLSSLDISKNIALTWLDCGSNFLTELDASKNTALVTLCCYFNQLNSLDVSKNSDLVNLLCYYNQLTTIDVTKNTALTYLSCGANKLGSLDLSKNAVLAYLYCAANQLRTLDVSKNPAITQLYCCENYLDSPNSIIGWLELGLIINSPSTIGSGTLLFYDQLIDNLYGDVNGDGTVDAFDALYLARHLAGWSGYEQISMAADVNGDGIVDAFDSLYLARHLAGWSGYEILGPK